MKPVKTLFIQVFITCGLVTLFAIALMALPQLSSQRAQIASTVAQPEEVLWIPIVLLLLALYWICLAQLIKTVANPLERLASEAKRGEPGFAFKTKSHTEEEDSLKHFLESKSLRVKESIGLAEDLETELDGARKETKTALEQNAQAQEKAEALRQQLSEAQGNCTALHSELEHLKSVLAEERKCKVGLEVQKRADEIYTQMEKAVSAAAYRSIWLPSTVYELKTPIASIRDLSTRLKTTFKSTWSQISIVEVSEDIAKICRLAEDQIALIEAIIAKRQPDSILPDAIPNPPQSSPSPAPSIEEPPIVQEAPKPESTPLESPEPLSSETPEPANEPIEPASTAAEESPDEIASTLPEPLADPNGEDFGSDSSANPNRPLRDCLQELVRELAGNHLNANIALAMNRKLKVDISDDTVVQLVRELTNVALSYFDNSEITIGVIPEANCYSVEIACDGDKRPDVQIQLEAAYDLANRIDCKIELDTPSEMELNLTFKYKPAQ